MIKTNYILSILVLLILISSCETEESPKSVLGEIESEIIDYKKLDTSYHKNHFFLFSLFRGLNELDSATNLHLSLCSETNYKLLEISSENVKLYQAYFLKDTLFRDSLKKEKIFPINIFYEKDYNTFISEQGINYLSIDIFVDEHKIIFDEQNKVIHFLYEQRNNGKFTPICDITYR